MAKTTTAPKTAAMLTPITVTKLTSSLADGTPIKNMKLRMSLLAVDLMHNDITSHDAREECWS